MKKFINVFSLLILLPFSAVNLYPKDALAENSQTQLKEIYSLYNKNPSGSCRQLEDVLQSPEASQLNPDETKKAYYFLANCNYQKKSLDRAVFYYIKVAELDPKDHLSLLYAGNIYAEQGFYGEAEKKYKEALQRVTGNRTEETRIQGMIDHVPGKLQKSFTVSTGAGYDSNVNSGPEDTIHLLYGIFNYTLNSNEKPRDDIFFNNRVGAAFNKALNPRTYLLLNIGANNTSYVSESDFNTSVFSTSMGYKKVLGNKSLTISPFINFQTLNEASYQISSGLNLSGAVRVSDRINVWPALSWFAQNFYNNNNRDAFGVSLGSSASYALNKKTSLVASLFYSYSDAKNDQFTYNNVFIGNSINRVIGESLTVALGYNLQLFYYDDTDPVFGSSRRDNGHTVYVNFAYSLKKLLKMDRASLNLNVSYNQNNSNQSFYDTNRLLSSLKFTISF